MTRTTPVISVVIPAYNAAQYIERTINSVLLQSFSEFEIIVVNDGSTDNTIVILDDIADPRIKVVQQDNAGVSAARNNGVQQAVAKYIYFLDADDIIAPDALTRCWQTLSQSPEMVAVYGESLTFIDDKQVESLLSATPHVMAKRPEGQIVKDLLKQNFICTGAIMVRKTAIKQLNGFSRKLKLGEDWVFWIELATLGRFVYLPMPVLCLYRQHPQSAARSLALNADEMTAAIDYIYQLPAVLKQFTTKQLVSLKKQAQANAYCYSAQEYLKRKQWNHARTLYLKSLKIRPFHIRTLILYSCSICRYIPQSVLKRLK
jgi:glycosyltransferase involved in cell wall biosynthesis